MPGLQGAESTLAYLLLIVAALGGFAGGLALVSVGNIRPGTEEFSLPVLGLLGCLGLLLSFVLVGFSVFITTTRAWPFGVMGVAIGMAAISFIGTYAFRTRDW
jgi:hypothetical protein